MNNSFSKKVNKILNENNVKSLKILLEEEEEKSNDSKDIFDFDSEEEASKDKDQDSSEDAGEESNEDKDQDSSEDDGESDLSSEDDASGLTDATIQQNTDDLEKIASRFKNIKNELGSIESIMSDAYISAAGEESLSVSESKIYTDFSIKNFLNEDTKSITKLTNAMEDLDSAIEKSTDVITRFKKGNDVDIEKYVASAINAYKNFDNLFSKHEIIRQGSINVLVLNSGSKSEEHIKEFEDLFYKELHSQFGIENKKYVIPVEKSNVATGAVKQG